VDESGARRKDPHKKDELARAVALVENFCAWLEGIRGNYRGHLKSLVEPDDANVGPHSAREDFPTWTSVFRPKTKNATGTQLA
jgi:hypothetical protein